MDPPLIAPGARAAELNHEQQAIYEGLLDRDETLAAMYFGALTVLADSGNPDRLAQCAHSVRELIEKLPKVMRVGVAPISQQSIEIEKLDAAFEAAGESEACHDGAWEGEIDGPLRALVRAVEALIGWRRSQRRTRTEITREMLSKADPHGRVVPGPLGERTVEQWMGAHRYFTAASHHGSVDESTFRERLASLEDVLLAQLRPRPFADFDELDRLLMEADVAD